MRAIILAAGLGTRMRPLSDATPKPLLPLAGKPIIVWQLQRLAAAGVRYVVINTARHGEQFPAALGDGSQFGLRIRYSHEGDTPLETGGGILQALPLLGEAVPFLVVSGDLYTDFDFARLPARPAGLAHLVLVDNPRWHAAGDFALTAQGRVRAEGNPRLTFANIGVYDPALWRDWRSIVGTEAAPAAQPPRFKLAPLLHAAIAQDAVGGEHHDGRWHNLGTVQELAALDDALRAAPT